MTAPAPTELLKRNEVLSFDDGVLTVKMSGHGVGNGWATLAFNEKQFELNDEGYQVVEIPPSELYELRDFLNRVLTERPGDRQAASVERAEVAGEVEWWLEPSLISQRVGALELAHNLSSDHKTRDALRAAIRSLASPPRSEGVRASEVPDWKQDQAETTRLMPRPWSEVQSATQISELDDASNACLELAAKHGYATGHGDTVADMIREFSAQIPTAAQASGIQPEVFTRRLELVRKFIAREYSDPAQELRGDWIDPRAKPAHNALCLCLQELASPLPSAQRKGVTEVGG